MPDAAKVLSIAPTLIQPLGQRVIVLSDHAHLLGYFCEFRFNPLHLRLLVSSIASSGFILAQRTAAQAGFDRFSAD